MSPKNGVLLVAGLLLTAPATVLAHEDEGLAEPLFFVSSLPSTEFEIENSYEHKDSENENELSFGASFALLDRLGLKIEVPYVFRDPNQGASQDDFGDIAVSGKLLLYRAKDDRIVFSIGGGYAAPTGNKSKEIDGTGHWSTFAAAGSAIPIGHGLPDLGLQVMAGWEQDIGISQEALEKAEELEVPIKREKSFVWGIGVNMKLFDGRFVPGVELLQKRIARTTAPADKGTITELGAGFWYLPFLEKENSLSPLPIGIAGKGPVSNHQDANYTLMAVLKYEFE